MERHHDIDPAADPRRHADGAHARRPGKISSKEFFDGKRVVIFGVPGAFTPTARSTTCRVTSKTRDALLAKGG